MPGKPPKRGPDDLSVEDAALLLGIHQRTFYALVHQGRIKKHYAPFTRRAHYSRTELLQLLEEEKARIKREEEGTAP